MGAFELTREIARDPATVWGVLGDVERTPEWYEAIVRVTPLAAPAVDAGAGARFELVRALPGGQAINVVEVTEFEPLERLTLTSRSGPTPFTYRYSLEPSPTGTRLTLHGDISAEGLSGPAGLLGPLATPLFKNGMRTNLGVLARLVEGS
ncbi:SRPBCC family protein [Agromyces subbeticus]|uniref:SRPBCC family protein n=1 Tax=Agromyces subbeticus TaxID=293890 RepID=UPI0003B34DC3|nr:SRPBCC family protein [Agromyces subbeticus]